MSVEKLNDSPISQVDLANKQKELFKKWSINIDDLLLWQENSVEASAKISESLFNDMFESPRFQNLMECLNKEQNITLTCDFLNNNLPLISQQTA